MVGGRRRVAVGCARTGAIVLALAAVSAGCGGGKPAAGASSPAAPAHTAKAMSLCGTTKTAANVQVKIEVQQHGGPSCGVAMGIEKDYATAIEAGKEPGNGGGGPAQVDGWTCRGFTTPVVLRTGNASKCVKGAAEILAILPAPA
jgi:ABC-type glycerol-3-phosphate transport system substrate-binding protein